LMEASIRSRERRLDSLRSMSLDNALELLVSTNSSERFDAAQALNMGRSGFGEEEGSWFWGEGRSPFGEEERSRLVKGLMAILNSTNSDEVKAYAVVVLGEFRAAEAAPLLVRHFEWDEIIANSADSAIPRREAETLRWSYPVSYALLQIGLPAIPALLNRIQETEGTNTTDKCVRLCRAIEGPAATQSRLQALLEKETDLKRKGRIQSALDVLTKLKPAR